MPDPEKPKPTVPFSQALMRERARYQIQFIRARLALKRAAAAEVEAAEILSQAQATKKAAERDVEEATQLLELALSESK